MPKLSTLRTRVLTLMLILAISVLTLVIVFSNQIKSAATVCGLAARDRDELAALRDAQKSEIQLGHVPLERQVRMTQDLSSKENLANQMQTNCINYNNYEREMADYERLSAQFDLSKLRDIPESQRVLLYKQAAVSETGPQSINERRRVLAIIEQNHQLYAKWFSDSLP